MSTLDWPPPIMAGIDGSATALLAVEWAAEQANARNLALRIVHAIGVPKAGYGKNLTPPSVYFDAVEHEGRAHIAEATTAARKHHPELAISTVLEREHPVRLLTRLSETAKLLVLGSRGSGTFSGMLLGSTSAATTAHAHCPVAVIHDHVPETGPVVVGIDGSPASETAIAWAFEEAALRDTELRAVHTWTDYVSDIAYARASLAVAEWKWHETEQDEILAERLAGWQEHYPEVTVRRIVARDKPAHLLREQAENARLLVIGSRGHGGFTGLLLGSTSHNLLHHPPCPVLIARPEPKA
ncbi:universal stress protein [Sciscionella sediminilitoris]|uniref:universal stress protein n=1 Tax=Sciscionella sediminilitoris TaxID=1445613 RepID=UPI0004DF6B28|nr:universal stress protein [Sciscionella sp. SE31]